MVKTAEDRYMNMSNRSLMRNEANSQDDESYIDMSGRGAKKTTQTSSSSGKKVTKKKVTGRKTVSKGEAEMLVGLARMRRMVKEYNTVKTSTVAVEILRQQLYNDIKHLVSGAIRLACAQDPGRTTIPPVVLQNQATIMQFADNIPAIE